MAEFHEEKPEFVRDAEARQSNILFPDTLRNGLSYNYFLWNGAPNATLVQRIGLVLYSLNSFTLSMCFVLLVAGDLEENFSWTAFFIGAILSLPTTYIAARMLRNAFRRK